jgi:hypothetical protein
MMSGSYAQSDAIWGIFGHAGPGGINMTADGANWSAVYSDPTHAPGGNCGAPNACLSSYASSQILHRVRFMLFGGCETAKRNATGHYELQEAAKADGVDSSIGFSTLITTGNQLSTWTNSFFYWSTVHGQNVLAAATSAEADVYNTPSYYHDYGGVQNSVVFGPTVVLKPAAYGN